MIINNLTFPTNLQYTIRRKTNNNIDVSCYNGAIIENDVFNLSFVEPFKIVFTNKRKHIICFMLQQQVNGKNKYEFFINSIEKNNKRTMTSLLDYVNKLL